MRCFRWIAGATAGAAAPVAFRKVDRALLQEIASGNIRTPTLYHHPNPILREGFWWRLREIDRQMARLGQKGGRCLDFACGNGAFIPTLAARFDKVACIDSDPSGAVEVVRRLALGNVTILQADIRDATFRRPFDCIVAADVLEHFVDLEVPVTCIRSWLAPGGLLFTSLPTENWLYAAIRWVFGIRKPDDHYHTANEVEQFLMARGFKPIVRRSLPVAGLALFTVMSWRRLEDGA